MKQKHIFHLIGRLILWLLVFCLLMAGISACSSKSGKTLMSLEGQKLPVNLYNLYISRYKAVLASNGYSVGDASFWNTIINKETQSTYDDFFCSRILDNCKLYLTVLWLFEKEGLSLSEEQKNSIEETMNEFLINDGDGSKAALNQILADYDVNYALLKDAYLIEAKYNALLQHYYGSRASQISDEIKNEFVKENYYCFKQLFVSYYYYVYELDDNGDIIYYDPETNQYMYDTENGKIRYEEGKVVKDRFNNPVYFLEDGSVAYDTVNGKKNEIDNDQDSYCDTEYYSSEEKAAQREKADTLYQYTQEHTMTLGMFEDMIDEYSDADNQFQYLKKDVTYSYSYVNQIAEALETLSVGGIALVETDYGCHILMSCSPESNAWEKETASGVFDSFADDIMSQFLYEKCQAYFEKITIDEKVLETALNFKTAPADYYY